MTRQKLKSAVFRGNFMQSVESKPTFQRNISSPSLRSRNKSSKKPACKQVLLGTAFTLVSFSAYSLTLKMEVICSSEMSVDFHQTTWRCILEDDTLHTHRCENLKFYKNKLFHKLVHIYLCVKKYRRSKYIRILRDQNL
jgi:hypothetical protein